MDLVELSPGYLLLIFIVFVIIAAPTLAYFIMRVVRRVRKEAGIENSKGTNSNISIIYILVLAASAVISILLFIGIAFFINMLLNK